MLKLINVVETATSNTYTYEGHQHLLIIDIRKPNKQVKLEKYQIEVKRNLNELMIVPTIKFHYGRKEFVADYNNLCLTLLKDQKLWELGMKTAFDFINEANELVRQYI